MSAADAPSAAAAPPPTVEEAGGSSPLTAEEKAEFIDLRRQNQLLRAENAVLQRRLDEERAQRLQWERDGNHFTAEAKACCEAIGKMDKEAHVLALYAELHRLREKCDVYADAVEESRNYFFEMKRLYTEVEPYLRSSGAPRGRASA